MATGTRTAARSATCFTAREAGSWLLLLLVCALVVASAPWFVAYFVLDVPASGMVPSNTHPLDAGLGSRPPHGSGPHGAAGAPAAVAERPLRHLWGSRRLVEYLEGDAPLIIAVPHDGDSEPDWVPDRETGEWKRDRFTLPLAYTIVNHYHRMYGLRPHLVVCHLHRSKLDANRRLKHAFKDELNSWAGKAFREYHRFIRQASTTVADTFGRGLFIDLHGQSHAEEWVEVGYRLATRAINMPDHQLDLLPSSADPELQKMWHKCTIKNLLGSLLQSNGYRTVPSDVIPRPGTKTYYIGGYSTRRHGSQARGTVDSIQIETPKHLRVNKHRRKRLAEAISRSLYAFLKIHYEFDFDV